MIEQTEKKVRVSTAVLLALLALAIEFIVAMWVCRAGGDARVVNYVSFAGTIVSIILAVLAIVYAYFQTFAQQRDTATLSAQVNLLKDTVQEVTRGTDVLSKDIGKFSELSSAIDGRLREIGQRSEDQLREIGQKIGALERSPGDRGATDLSREQMQRMLERASSSQLAMHLALIIGAERELTDQEILRAHVWPAMKEEGQKDYAAGFFFATSFMLIDLRILGFEDKRLKLREPQFATLLRAWLADHPQANSKAWINADRVQATLPS